MKKWTVQLICCGRDDGFFYADTWKEANEFRESYTSGPRVNSEDGSGHKRSAIIIAAPTN